MAGQQAAAKRRNEPPPLFVRATTQMWVNATAEDLAETGESGGRPRLRNTKEPFEVCALT